jgi:two-component system, chemotaxis family, CheB/CheR fusion protein
VQSSERSIQEVSLDNAETARLMTDADEGDDRDLRSDLPPVVGIGASAGGLSALKALFRCMPADTGLAFVVVVHLSPKHESHLADLLQSHTPMPVTQVSGTVRMEPDRVYVIPPGSNLAAVDTHLRLSELEVERNQRAPIDRFFETLARTHRRTAIGVVLTGTGSDGTLGLQRIREQGGLTLAQDPAEAEYDAMPQSAISRGVVDHVLPLSEIPDRIVRFARHGPMVRGPDDEGGVGGGDPHAMEILAEVHARTGHDVTGYKADMVMRRIRRRMKLQQTENLAAYAERIRSDPDEAGQLLDDLLINVTRFFQDPETFAVLERDLLPGLFEGRTGRDRVRAWSVGCATGEEAYSLAMLLLEQASRLERPPRVQVFATDLREASLRVARAGLYPDTIENDIAPDRLGRFFVREGHQYRVRPALREVVVFAPHSVTKDPPFSRLDLISCREMLGFLQQEVQEEVLSLFHYALRPGGHLWLGSSEAMERSGLFRRTDMSHRIYRRREGPAEGMRLPGFPLTPARRARRDPGAVKRAQGPPGPEDLHLQMVEACAPPSVLIDEHHALLHASARAGRYLTIPSGEPTRDVFHLVREPLRLAVQAGLLAARELRESHRSRPIRLELDGQTTHVTVRVMPADAEELAHLYLVTFDEVAAPDAGGAEDGGAPGDLVQELEGEPADARLHLEALIEGYEASQEEMQAFNEELQSINEELRSTTEELETSKEELQSINEELATVNQENRHKVEELAQLAGDLQNLFASTHIATLFLDRQLRIMRYTPPLTELFNVRPADRGRPISDLTHRLGDVDLEADARQVLRALVPITREIQGDDERWFLTRFLPYRSTEDRIEGVIITFVDITEGKEAERAIREAKLFAESIVQTLHEPLLVMTSDLKVQSANDAFYEQFKLDREATIGRRIFELGNEQWDIPGLRTLLEQVLPDDEAFDDYEVRHTFEAIGERVMLVNARRLDDVQLILLGIRDITVRRKAEERLAVETLGLARLNELSERLWQAPGLEAGLDEMLEGTLSLMDADRGNIQLLDQGLHRIVARRGLDQGFVDALDGIPPEECVACDRALRTRDVVVIDDVEADGAYEPLLPVARAEGYRAVTSVPLVGSQGTVLGVLSVFFDVPRRPSDQELERLRLYGRLAASFIERERTTVPLWELGRTLMMAEQEERRRIGQFLHDDLQQLLFGIRLRIESLANESGPFDRSELTRELLEVLDWIRDAIGSTRELSEDLVSGVLEGSDLGEALEWLVVRMSERYRLKVDLRVESEVGILGDNRDVFLFQVVRELLFNVVKHAGVLEATVRLRRAEGSIELEVSDEGAGFDPQEAEPSRSGRTGLGLFSVRERIRLVGGTLEIDSAPGKGTHIRITAPLSRPPVTREGVVNAQEVR